MTSSILSPLIIVSRLCTTNKMSDVRDVNDMWASQTGIEIRNSMSTMGRSLFKLRRIPTRQYISPSVMRTSGFNGHNTLGRC